MQKGTGDYDITINVGTYLCDGVMIYENAALADQVTLDAPSGSDRIDVIYATFAYAASTTQPDAAYAISKGTPSASPVEPTLSTAQVKIASIKVPSTANDLDDCFIANAATLQEQVTMLLGVKVQSNVWASIISDPFILATQPTLSMIYEQGIMDGDIWIELGGMDIYLYDATANVWISSDTLAHASSHKCGASDELDVKNLCDTSNYLHQATAPEHNDLGLSHDALVDVSIDDHHNRDHYSTHHTGQADPLDVQNLVDALGYLHLHAVALATDPHGNGAHDPEMALADHEHEIDAVTGVIEKGSLEAGYAPTVDVPTGEFYSSVFPDISITDSIIRVARLEVSLASAGSPSGAITFTFKRNGVSIGTVVVGSGNTKGKSDLSPTVTLTPYTDRMSIEGPADALGATGAVAKIIWERYVAPAGG